MYKGINRYICILLGLMLATTAYGQPKVYFFDDKGAVILRTEADKSVPVNDVKDPAIVKGRATISVVESGTVKSAELMPLKPLDSSNSLGQGASEKLKQLNKSEYISLDPVPVEATREKAKADAGFSFGDWLGSIFTGGSEASKKDVGVAPSSSDFLPRYVLPPHPADFVGCVFPALEIRIDFDKFKSRRTATGYPSGLDLRLAKMGPKATARSDRMLSDLSAYFSSVTGVLTGGGTSSKLAEPVRLLWGADEGEVVSEVISRWLRLAGWNVAIWPEDVSACKLPVCTDTATFVLEADVRYGDMPVAEAITKLHRALPFNRNTNIYISEVEKRIVFSNKE